MMPKKNIHYSTIAINFRTLYGKLFASLYKQFNTIPVYYIEEAIQNAFYKALKSWKHNAIPKQPENWFFIVAKNDLLNQLKKTTYAIADKTLSTDTEQEIETTKDLRLETLLYFASLPFISPESKLLFILKNLFGLHVKEISSCTLIEQETIYKRISRTKKKIQQQKLQNPLTVVRLTPETLAVTEEILYAVFNLGFDSIHEKNEELVNEDLCLDAMALLKKLLEKTKETSTRNLFSLFCFHIARLQTKQANNIPIPFFKQERSQWDQRFIHLGFQYLNKPQKLTKFYIEAVMISNHMTTPRFDHAYWEDITYYYRLLTDITTSPIPKINLCYCLHKINKTEEAIQILNNIKHQLPENHLYYTLVYAELVKDTSPKTTSSLLHTLLETLPQSFRKKYILEQLLSE